MATIACATMAICDTAIWYWSSAERHETPVGNYDTLSWIFGTTPGSLYVTYSDRRAGKVPTWDLAPLAPAWHCTWGNRQGWRFAHIAAPHWAVFLGLAAGTCIFSELSRRRHAGLGTRLLLLTFTATYFGLLYWVAQPGIATRVFGCLLLALVLYATLALLLPTLSNHRPSRTLVSLTGTLALPSFSAWIASVILSVTWTIGTDERWFFEAGALAHIPTGAGYGYALQPGLSICVDPSPENLFAFGGTEYHWSTAYSNEIRTYPFWPLAFATIIPAFALSRLRRTRIPRGHCRCGYNLTGNTSGVCPECGRAVPLELKASLRPAR